MKKIILSILAGLFSLAGLSQMTIGSGAQWNMTGNAAVVLNDLSLVNDGTLSAGTGSFRFTGMQPTGIAGTSHPVFYSVEIAKTNNAVVRIARDITVTHAINFTSGLLDVWNSNIKLAGGAILNGENEATRLIGTGQGYIETALDLNSPNNSNPGNLGAVITSAANLGIVTIRRGHNAQAGSGLTTSINRYYSITPANNINLDATLRMKYLDAELNGQTEASLVMYQSVTNGISWTNLSQSGRNTNTNYVEKSGLGSLALQTLANNNFQLVNGVTGLVFTGQRKKPSEVTLKWTSQTETNMSYYLVQRKLDTELSFSDRAAVNTLAPGGNSATPLNYQNVDVNPHPGNTSYRLKIIAADNSFTYSNVIIVEGKTKGIGNSLNGPGQNKVVAADATITVGPNPNNGNFWFRVSGIDKETVAVLYTIDGKQLQQFQVVNLRQQYVSGLRSGIYLLAIPGLETQRILVNGEGAGAPYQNRTNDHQKF